jgi:hypothetical protein
MLVPLPHLVLFWIICFQGVTLRNVLSSSRAGGALAALGSAGLRS